MLDVADTIYPTLKARPTPLELQLLFTPTQTEIQQAQNSTRSPAGRLTRLVLLKVAQHLRQLVFLKDIPSVIHKHVARTLQISVALPKLLGQDHPTLRQDHLAFLKAQLHWETPSLQQVEDLLKKHTERFDDLISILNASIEDITRRHFVLPGFTNLVRTARQVRSDVNDRIYEQVWDLLGEEGRIRLDTLFQGELDETVSIWGSLKQDSSKATVSQMKHVLKKLESLGELTPTVEVTGLMSRSKRDQWVQEALSHNRQAMVRLKPRKRYTLALLLLQACQARIRDDLGTMLVKTMFRLRSGALNRLKLLQVQHQTHTDQLVEQLRGVAEVLGTEHLEPGEVLKKLKKAMPDPGRTLQGIDEYQGRSRDNFVPFMLRRYPSHRTALMGLLKSMKFKSTSENTDLEQAVRYVLESEGERSLNLSTFTTRYEGPDENVQVIPLVPLSWVPEVWAPFVFSQQGRRTMVWEGYPLGVHRHYFELCVLLHLAWELKSGDMCILESEAYADHTQELITETEYQRELPVFLEQMNLPSSLPAVVRQLKARLQQTSREADRKLGNPGKTGAKLQGEHLTLSRPVASTLPAGFQEHRNRLLSRLKRHKPTVLDALYDTEHLTQFSRVFRPLSGLQSKLIDPTTRYITTVFCYGCNLGPSQTARSLPGTDRRDFEWVSRHHITEKTLQEATVRVINHYQKFQLPRLWGSGEHASADGTKWELLENNLMSEYHIRYGGLGGLGYYHVSDKYIALFSHFIPCGVWEAVYILDGLLQNTSDIQPDKLHADTQGQSAPVFGMAYLLGIELLPRIRNWQDLHFYRAEKSDKFKTIGSLFKGNIDWELIERYLPDMLRIVLSIKLGRISAATVLKRLGSYNRKNRVYQAFKELGLAVRTIFLLRYISDQDLRFSILRETNKSEQFNNFVQWCFFGGDGVVGTNHRDEQVKRIKYGTLVANCLIYHSVYLLTEAAKELKAEGRPVPEEVLRHMNPFLTGHLNRFGTFVWEGMKPPKEADYDFGWS